MITSDALGSARVIIVLIMLTGCQRTPGGAAVARHAQAGKRPQLAAGPPRSGLSATSVRAVTDLSALGEETLGVWTRQQARVWLSAGQVDELVRTGTWQVVWPGVYADGGYVLSAEQRAFAATLATGAGERPHERREAMAFGRTAARVWQLPLIDDDDPATGARDQLHDDVAVPRQREDVRSQDRILHRHQPRLRRSDLVQRDSGLWLTAPLRTLVDCRLLLSHEALVCAMDDALHRKLVSAADLGAAVERTVGWRGGPAFRRAVLLADGRAESPGETLARLVLKPALPGLVPQVRLFDAAARLVSRFDLADEEVKLAVEFDGVRLHAGAQMVARDRRRDRRTGGFGWCTERVTWFEVRRAQAALRQRIVEKDAELRAAVRSLDTSA